MPEPLAGRMPLFNVRVGGGAVLVPVWSVAAGIDRGAQAAYEIGRLSGRGSLARTLGKLRRGEAITIAAQGDSIIAIESQPPEGAGGATVNGQWRDRATGPYLFSAFPTDTVLIVRDNYDFGDGAGGVHSKFGKVWEVIRSLQQAYGSTITYLNMAIGGTASGGGATNPRLATLVAVKPDLTFIGFGMNELGQPAIEDNVNTMLSAIYAWGGDAIVVATPRPNATYNKDAEWQITCDALKRAAERHVELVDTGTGFLPPGSTSVRGERVIRTAAFHDSRFVSSPAAPGPMGIAATDLCQANLFNHPGIREHKIEGALMARFFA